MIDFDKSRLEAINELRKVEDVRILSADEVEILGYRDDLTYIHVNTNILGPNNKGMEINFYVEFPASFPLVIPRIFIPLVGIGPYEFLPHIDKKGLVCTFDPDTTRTDPNNPKGILLECISKAKSIIESGLSGKNFSDYQDEFLAYWAIEYQNDNVSRNILCLFDLEPEERNLKFLKLDKPLGVFKYIVHIGDADAANFLKYLEFKGIKYEEQPICYVGNIKIDFTPPLSLQNKTIKRIVQGLDLVTQSRFKSFINSKKKSKFIAANISAGGGSHFVGWFHDEIVVKVKNKGWRKGQASAYDLLSGSNSNDFVKRELPLVYSPGQKMMRADGFKQDYKDRKKFLVAGLGSVGSNLTYHLNSFTDAELRLVDNDLLSINNMNRHFLGFSYLNLPKAKAMRDFLWHKNPFQVITVRNESIIRVYLDSPEFVNEVNFIFMVTGNHNVDDYIASQIEFGNIKVPMFIIWVEPYLAGGHCVYLPPGGTAYSNLYNDNLYIHNVIDPSIYKAAHPALNLKEAGCQTSYMPYSQSDVNLFLSALFPNILATINNPAIKTICWTWVGDIENAINIGFDVAEKYIGIVPGTVISYQ
jgi:hypothetical protein